MKTEIMTIHVNDVDFYCEKRGRGPSIVLVPDGDNDCEPFSKLMELLAKQFTVVTFDMRGATRSEDHAPQKVTPKRLADDVAGIIKAMHLEPVSAYGCSSGGQTVLALGKFHPEICRNIMPHEAALQSDTMLPDTGFMFFEKLFSMEKYCTDGATPGDFWSSVSAEGIEAVSEECRSRIRENGKFWREFYLGTVDRDQYSAQDFALMPPVDFTVGTWSPSWLTYANIVTAQRGNCPYTWMQCAHHPERTCPEELAEHITVTVKKYLHSK